MGTGDGVGDTPGCPKTVVIIAHTAEKSKVFCGFFRLLRQIFSFSAFLRAVLCVRHRNTQLKYFTA